MPIQKCTLPEGGDGWKWGESGHCYSDRADAEKQAAAAHANGYTGDEALALDRAASSRTIDADGHMRVLGSAVSKAVVNPYWGREIPDADKLGLDTNRLYQLYRDPSALKDAAESLNGKPLLIIHKAVSADDHDHEVVVGSVDNARWDDPYLRADLTIWVQDAIDAVQSGAKKELSCAYRYTPVMHPGTTWDGTFYDGSMQGIFYNHVALVAEGRAGPDCMVGDSALEIPEIIPATTPVEDTKPDFISPYLNKEIVMANRAVFSRTALSASGALRAYLIPKIAADQTIDMAPFLKGVNAKNWGASKPKIKAALDTALEGKLAEGATLVDLMDMLNIAVDASPDDDDDEDDDKKKKKAAEDKEEDKKEAEDEDKDDKKSAEDEDDDESAMDEDDDDDDDKKKPAFLKGKDKKGAKDSDMPVAGKESTIKKSAMDAAIKLAVDRATRDAAANATVQTMTRMRAIQEAERIVRPYIGELAIAQDSAADVYRLCLDHAGIDLEGVPEAAFPAMVKMLPKPGETKPVVQKKQAYDASLMGDMLKRFPGVTALKQR